jgi:hypothetical protein
MRDITELRSYVWRGGCRLLAIWRAYRLCDVHGSFNLKILLVAGAVLVVVALVMALVDAVT